MFSAQNIFTKNIQRNFDIVTIVCADNFMVVTKKKFLYIILVENKKEVDKYGNKSPVWRQSQKWCG